MLRILTVRQPWSSLIVLGFKPIENRGWGTDYRGDVAIIAGRALDTGERAQHAFAKYLAPMGWERVANLPRGGVIGVGELYDITRMSDSWWFTGPVGLILRNPRQTSRLLPMPGNLSMFSATESDEETIRAHLVPSTFIAA